MPKPDSLGQFEQLGAIPILVQELKKQLAELERGLPPQLVQALSKKLDLDLQLLACRSELPTLEAESTAARRRVDRLLTLQAEAAPLTPGVQPMNCAGRAPTAGRPPR